MDGSRAAPTGERTTLPLGIFFWTALSKRKPNALSAAATSTDADGSAGCVAAAPNTVAATNMASSPCLRCMVPSVSRLPHSLVRTGTSQLIDQAHSGRATPTSPQIVARGGVEAAAVARRGWVAAAGYVVECAGVARADAEVVERGIDEPHSAPSVRHGLLIDQGQKTCPAWRGKARAAVAGHEPAIDHGGIVEIRFRRHIGRVAQGCRAQIRRIDYARELLPAGNRRAADIATAALRPAGFC